MKARWIVQKNLLAENDLNQIKKACQLNNTEYYDVLVIPFSKKLPLFPLSDKYENIYFGSTTFMNNVYEQLKPKGLFYNDNFSMENYCNVWGTEMLNYDSQHITIDEFLKSNNDQSDDIFIRPDGDGKQFDGQVVKRNNAVSFIKRHLEYDNNINLDTKILVGKPYNILREWRCVIVDGKIVTASMYRKNFKLYKSATEIPKSMLEYVENMIEIYKPHDCFAIDIAEVNDDNKPKYFIIECGCLNSIGFYLCDIKKIITSITNYIENGSI